jgi:hypothetical protein
LEKGDNGIYRCRSFSSGESDKQLAIKTYTRQKLNRNWRETTMAIEKKSIVSKKAAAPTPLKKKSTTKAKIDTAKPAASKVVAALKIYQY